MKNMSLIFGFLGGTYRGGSAAVLDAESWSVSKTDNVPLDQTADVELVDNCSCSCSETDDLDDDEDDEDEDDDDEDDDDYVDDDETGDSDNRALDECGYDEDGAVRRSLRTSRIAQCFQFAVKHYKRFQSCVKKLVEHKYFQQGLLGAILINTLSMGIEYHNQVRRWTPLYPQRRSVMGRT